MYRTLDAMFWQDPDVRALGRDARDLLLYLITNPHSHLCGLYYIPIPTIEHELLWGGKGLRRAFGGASEGDMAHYDLHNEVVFVKSMFRYQGRGGNHEKSAAAQVRLLRRSPLAARFLEVYPEVAKHLDEGALKGVQEGLRRGSGGGSGMVHSGEGEGTGEGDGSSSLRFEDPSGASLRYAPATGGGACPACGGRGVHEAEGVSHQCGVCSGSGQLSEKQLIARKVQSDEVRGRMSIGQVVNVWNEDCGNFPRVQELTDERKRKIVARIRKPGANQFCGRLRRALEIARESEFLREGTWFTFDWCVANDTNLAKVLEGNYGTGAGTSETALSAARERAERRAGKSLGPTGAASQT